MYAGLFPSAHSFSSSVFANVKFAVREIEVPTGELTRNLSSPAWMAIVASANRRPCTVFFMASQLAAAGQITSSTNLAESPRGSLRNGHPAKVYTSYRPPGFAGPLPLQSLFWRCVLAPRNQGAARASFLPRCSCRDAAFPCPLARFRLLFAAVFA